ncbi:hypothetical protein M426DRAFT_13679 [Hypoxylon sp. CI-4A]|nr:hypothetical protein M426DRAFT_13679 [Hypoxylon sp. CI-4A]
MASSRVDWTAEEMDYWSDIAVSRQREDAKRKADYDVRQDQTRSLLIKLYDRKEELERELPVVTRSIQVHEQRQEQLVEDFEEEASRVQTERQEADRAQVQHLLHLREENASKENVRPKSSSGRRQSNREVPASANGAGWTSINGGARRKGRKEEEQELPADPGNLLSSIYHNPVDESESLNGRAMPLRSGAGNRRANGVSSNGVSSETGTDSPEGYLAGRTKDRPLKPKQRHSLPSFPASNSPVNGRTAVPTPPSETKPAKPPTGRRSLPSAKGSAPPTESPDPAETEVREIYRDRLVLKDDGKVMTEPPMYAGIPLERIDKNHPYWDAEWEPLEDVIGPQLQKWKEKLEDLRRNTNSVRHTIFLANRQVNRGQAIVDFVRDGPWHPYQFVGKDMMAKSYKTLINYDTMFRLVNVHEELKKFDLDVSPLEWLRQRFYDVAEEQGDKFNLSKTTHDLYHDACLKMLREKHGFGNIGRPSGYKLREKDPEKAASKKIKQESTTASRRKARRSIGQVDRDDTPSTIEAPNGQEQPHQQEYLEPVTPRQQKRQRLEPETDDLEYSGYTSVDSFSAGRIMHLDFRVHQIKTRHLTTSTEVTQYWTFSLDKRLFEHQVLREVHPKVAWDIYEKAINFNIELEEIEEIQYASDDQRIIVVTNDETRGNVLALFKRDRTKRRFLTFTKKRGIILTKTTSAQIEEAWRTLESKVKPNEESDA